MHTHTHSLTHTHTHTHSLTHTHTHSTVGFIPHLALKVYSGSFFAARLFWILFHSRAQGARLDFSATLHYKCIKLYLDLSACVSVCVCVFWVRLRVCVCGTGPQYFFYFIFYLFFFFSQIHAQSGLSLGFLIKNWRTKSELSFNRFELSSLHTGSDQMMDRKRTLGRFRYVLLINFIECCVDTFYALH